MYNIKNNIFLTLTKRQKASLLTYLKAFTKNNKELNEEEILYKFIDEEEYYFKIGQPHLYFVVENLENDDFMRDIKKYIKAVLEEIEYKNSQKPIIEKQKLLAKEARKKASEYKMKKEKPTPKQLKYYKMLCKHHNIQEENTENASRFDLKNLISKILEDNE